MQIFSHGKAGFLRDASGSIPMWHTHFCRIPISGFLQILAVLRVSASAVSFSHSNHA
jgi:hypothetical protein